MTKEFIETQMDRVGMLWNSEKDTEKKQQLWEELQYLAKEHAKIVENK